MKAKPFNLDPSSWIAIANERAPQSASVTEWFSGETAPGVTGYYERHFTDGNVIQWWDGKEWRSHNPHELKGSAPHWRQVGDYPYWRGLK
ncbi:MAG: hypothetical protein PHV02_03365 [Rhodocyclaceae bacterium]|nr:hypothetical protein [Rhodocyclaceae bacterium]